MKNIFLTFTLVLITSLTFAQVGIGTTTPKTTLQIKGKETNTITPDGLQIPTLSLTQLDAKIAPPNAYTAVQDGTIVYINDITGGATETQTAAILAKDFYYYDASSDSWKLVGGSSIEQLSIGDSYQGGIIFWLDATGQHGLIAATADQSTGIQWYNGISRYTGTIGDGLYSGSMNTAMIVSTQMADNQAGNFAAKVCSDYSVTISGITYGDWYLPSLYELDLLYLQSTLVGGFDTAKIYWSSCEQDITNTRAWYKFFGNGIQSVTSKAVAGNVRAVRSF